MAEALKEITEGLDVVWVGCDNGLEVQVVPAAGYKLETLPIRSLPRKPSLKVLSFAGSLALSLARSSSLIKKHKPDVVVGMGGFASYPMVLVASRRGCHTVIHEQNAVPGLTNRWLSKRVDLVALAYDYNQQMLKNPKNVEVVGNPVRSAVLAADRAEALKKLGLDEGPVTVLVFGGSRGARKINQSVIDAYDDFREDQDLRIVHIAGMIEHDEVKDQIDKIKRSTDKVKYHLFPYIQEMGAAYAVADLAVTRAGASTVAELTARGLPSILIPYPYATDNHQFVNAQNLETAGAAKIISDQDINADKLYKAVSGLVHDPQQLKQMRERAVKFGRPQAARNLAERILKIADKTYTKREESV